MFINIELRIIIMKRLLGIIFLFCGASHLNAQKLSSSQDSIQVFYKDLFKDLKTGYLYRDQVNWDSIQAEVGQNLKQYSDFRSSLKEVSTIFDLAKADHCRVYYEQEQLAGNFETPTGKDFSEQWITKYTTNPEFEAKVIHEDIGYILMPEMTFTDVSKKNIQNLAQPMYDQIQEIKNSGKIKGWILDLRMNTGGNSEPMLLALYDLLGDHEIWGVLDIHKKKITSVKLSNGKYFNNSKKSSYITPEGALQDTAKVAVITNLATGSSGEVTALAFKGRENTIFIGQRTNGKTTTNTMVSLPFGAIMAITVGLDCDRNGNFYEYIIPDIQISKQDNFEDLLLDGNIQEAIKYISSEE